MDHNREDATHSSAKIRKLSLSWDMCIICQTSGGVLVDNPSAYDKVLSAIRERAKYGDGKYPEINAHLSEYTIDDLVKNNASWHRDCHREATSKDKLDRAKARYNKAIFSKVGSAQGQDEHSPTVLTRRSLTPFRKDDCFFCQEKGTRRFPLSKVATDTAGEKLQQAVQKSNNTVLQIRLNTAIDPKDAHANDIRYHKNCWLTHVTNALLEQESTHNKTTAALCEYAAEVEFISIAKRSLNNMNVLNMNDLCTLFNNVRLANGIKNSNISNRQVKQLLIDNISDVIFSKPLHANESERVSLNETKHKAMQMLEEHQNEASIQNLFSSAKYLRKQILEADKWEFSGSINTQNLIGKSIPNMLYIFLRWLIIGTSNASSPKLTTVLDNRVLNLSQHVMYSTITNKQASGSKTTADIHHNYEWPLQVGVGLTAHSTFRSKELVDFLHGLCISVDYKRVLAVENQIANDTIHQMSSNQGVYIPRNFVKDRHTFFAIDNCDFQEDTQNGKNTLHGTVMNIYQKCDMADVCQPLVIDKSIHDKRLLELPGINTTIEECRIPASSKPVCKTFPNPLLSQTIATFPPSELVWLMAYYFSKESTIPDYNTRTIDIKHSNAPPTWSAFNSEISSSLPLTRVGTPPLIAAPAHEFSTLMSVFKLAQKVTTVLVGEHRKTVISVDLGLYKPAQKMLMAKKDVIHDIILRPGELHIVIAMLRTIGSYIDNSGLDAAWLHADLYGQSTIKQILDGNHVSRGLKAHITSLVSLCHLLLESYLQKNRQHIQTFMPDVTTLNDVCSDNQDIGEAYAKVLTAIEQNDLSTDLAVFSNDGKPMHIAFVTYIKMVMCMLQFQRSVRTGDWLLHLSSLQEFVKYFFAMDRLNYARMIPLYLAEMIELKTTDPSIWSEFESGNWVVNRSSIAFCALGADHALEQVNRWMKVSGGLVGITQNENARTRFFLVSPELSRIKEELKEILNVGSVKNDTHHELTPSNRKLLDTNVAKLTNTITSFVNPFTYDENDILNIVTKAIVTDKVQSDIVALETIGMSKMNQFVDQRLKSSSVPFWDPMKKVNLKLWKESLKCKNVSVGNQTLELKEDRGLFARMLIVANSRTEVNLEDTLGKYELSVVPRALFAADGTINHVSDKSQLMSILEKKAVHDDTENSDRTNVLDNVSVAVVDAMVLVQALDKPASIKTCEQLADHFVNKLQSKFRKYDEVHIVFDRYDVQKSLKTATRVKRQGKKQPIAYHITDSTNIEHVQMQTLLSCTSTKDELSVYLANKIVYRAEENEMCYVVAFRNKVISSKIDVKHLESSQEEADTKMLLHAVDAKIRGAKHIDIYSCDTDVFILSLRRYEDLPQTTSFITGTGDKKRTISLEPIFNAIGRRVALSLPGFHALSGADNTGSFAGKGKLSCWKAFEMSSNDVQQAFQRLSCDDQIDNKIIDLLEEFVCTLYQPGTTIKQLCELRWWMFRRKQAESDKLPPTKAAFLQAVARAHYQCIVWNNDTKTNPELPNPEQYGWKKGEDVYVPVMTTDPPAPDTLMQLTKCNCGKSMCNTTRCKCRANKLGCTELCACGADDDVCSNVECVEVDL